MDQLNSYADDRLVNGCIYCGGPEETRDHVPSRVLLDPPLPDNLPVVGACQSCNIGFSVDEEYVACIIEAVIAGSTDPSRLRRPKVAEILRHTPMLRSRIEAAKSEDGGRTSFRVEADRVRNVILKLARGHAVFELSQPCREEPSSVAWWPIGLMSDDERHAYDGSRARLPFGEVGSRGMQRLLIVQVVLESATGSRSRMNLLINDWVHVQDGRYRYLAVDDADGIRVKIVIGDYLACEVVWLSN